MAVGGAGPRRKGSAWERRVRDYLRARGFDCERAYGAGRPDDRGDLIIGAWTRLLVECKAAKETRRGTWITEARDKARSWRGEELVPLIVEPRRNCAVERAYVTLELSALCDLIDLVARRVAYLDEQGPA